MHKPSKSQKGSVSLIVIAAVSVAALVAGGVYSVNKLNKLEAENQQLKEAVTNEQEEEQATSSASEEKDEAEEETFESETRVVYAPTPPQTNTQAEVETSLSVQEDIADSSIESQETENEEEPDNESEPEVPKFSVNYATQKIVSGQASTTGEFELSLSVSADGGDVYVPMTTNDSVSGDSSTSLATRDSVGDNIIGISYEIDGDEFRGGQTSEISCPLKHDDRCKIEEGKTSSIKVLVTLTPEEPGNYSVVFDKVNYIQNNEVETYSLNEETGTLYLR